MKNTKDAFVENLKRLRKRQFPSQGEFAPKVNLSERGYQKYEQGESDPTPEILDRFAKALGVHPLDLLKNEGEQSVRPQRLVGQDLKILIEGAGEDIPIRLLEPLLEAFLGSDAAGRATALAALLDDDSIAAPYLKKPSVRAKAAKAR